MSRPLRVNFFTLTDTESSEHIYMSSLQSALQDRGVTFVSDWRKADIIHLFEYNFLTKSTLSTGQFVDLSRALYSEIPVVVSTDDLYFTGEPSLTAHPTLYWFNHYLQRGLFNACDSVIAISESVRENLRDYIDQTDIQTVLHGVDDRYRTDSVQICQDPMILHVSLASKRKNPTAVREVARRLDHRFVIAGSEWDRRIPDTDEFNNVEVTGYVSEQDLVRLYKNAGIFYFPTRYEGFGLPVLEAMAAGTAVVSSDVYSVPEVVGESGLLYEPDDIETHLAAIQDLISDREYLLRHAERGVKRASKFSWETAAKETKSVYKSSV